MEMRKRLTIIVPCYNEQESIRLFYDETIRVLQTGRMTDLEIDFLFINDGSQDESLKIMKDLAAEHSNVHYLSFSRNFGKESAMYAGLERSAGDYVALMDVDLQDPPRLLEQMYAAIIGEGYDCVATRRMTRKGEPLLRSGFARLFYIIINLLSKTEIVGGARDFRFMTRQVVDAILSLKEYNRFSKGICEWIGFREKWLAYENVGRVAGKTKWSFMSLFIYSLDGILAFSVAPLALSSLLGVFLSVLSLLVIIAIITRTLLFGDPVSGWPSLASIVCFIGGLQLLCLGIIGQYLSKIYLETKRHPIYIVKETNLSKGNPNGPD